ncbi:unnamed protein product [Peniophora sp. CBMAI 1063]|nr:unnamed protein product [Peniophora sp. CBMAI 1063]
MFTPSNLLLPVLLAASALAHPHPNTPRDVHQHQARNVTERDIISDLGHYTSARWTYYTPGLGACGAYSKESDYIVALNSAQWDGGKHCWQHIKMQYGGKTADATVVDQCPGCPHGGLDLSPGLFKYFGSESLGVLSGSWSFT